MPDPVVSVEWLAERLGRPDVQVVDATLPKVGQPGEGRDLYAAGHIPGAVFFDINRIADLSTDLPHMLPSPDAFARMAGELGLRREAEVVVYDAHGIYSSPRAWWTLRVMDFPRVHVLEGGLPAWKARGGAVETGEPRVAATVLEPAFEAALVRDLEAVRSALGAGSEQVVDARSAARFRGEAAEPRPGLRSGHMPGALNLPFELVLEDGERLKAPEALRQIFEAAGVDLARPMVTSCGSGITAAILALAAARLGYDNVAVYDGSWAEWGARPDTQVVTGAGPIHIRRAREADLPEIPRIELSAAQAFQGLDVPAFLLTQASEAEQWRAHLEAGLLWVAEAEGRVVGFLAARREGTRLHIDELDVQQDMQGRGLGRRLVSHVTEWARGNGFSALSLTTFRNVAWNAPFYASCGFEEWPEAAAPASIQAILRAEAAKGLKDRCAMRLRF